MIDEKLNQYELEKKKIRETSKNQKDYEEKIKELIEKLEI